MNGIIFVVFGREYERFAIDCMKHSRKNTSLPFHVLTNNKPVSTRFSQVSGVTFRHFNLKDHENRQVKTTAAFFSPFDNTLLLDADVVIQKEINFDMLKDVDLVLNRFTRWNKGDKILRIYKRAFKQFKVSLPVDIYNGAFVMFRNNVKTREFFNSWNRFWKLFGKQREMPCLACVVNKANMKVKNLPKGYLGLDNMVEGATIQHRNQHFFKKYNIKPLNKTDSMAKKGDFSWVDYEL